MEELTQKRESEIEQTIRAELEAPKSILVAELQQGDNYTKRAHPTVVYVGLVFILMEILGLRHLILSSPDFGEKAATIIDGPDSNFDTFLMAWPRVVGVYAVGRSVEKKGTRNAWASAITGSGPNDLTSVPEKAIMKNIKNKLREIKW